MNESKVVTIARNRHSWYMGASAIVVLIIIGIAAWFYSPARAYVVLHLPAPSVNGLADASFVSESSATHGAILGSTKESIKGTLISVYRDAKGEVLVIKDGDTYKVLEDGKDVYEAEVPLIHVTRSPDGTRIAFAKLVGDTSAYASPNEYPVVPLFPKDWSVSVYEPATRTNIELGDGLEPMFRADSSVVWVSSAGIAEADLQDGSLTLLLQQKGLITPETALRSSNNQILGVYDATIQNVLVYQVKDSVVMNAATLPITRSYHSASFSDDALYTIQKNFWGSKILRTPFATAIQEKVGFIPSVYSVGRIVIGSL